MWKEKTKSNGGSSGSACGVVLRGLGFKSCVCQLFVNLNCFIILRVCLRLEEYDKIINKYELPRKTNWLDGYVCT